MKTMKKLATILIALCLGMAALALPASAGPVMDGLKESTRTVHEINKENFAATKADAKENFQKATAPNPDFQRFLKAKGLGNKIKVIWENIVAGAAENTAKEIARRNEIQSFNSYKELLEKQRESRQATINGTK